MYKLKTTETAYPRVLVLSNECFANSSSNGRTLGNFVNGLPKSKIAQFFLSGNPDGMVCEKFYQVTDKQALKTFLCKSIPYGTIVVSKSDAPLGKLSGTNRTVQKNAVTMLLRELIWESGRWKKYGFHKWVEEYQPQLILLQAGNSGFMCELAVQLSEQYSAPLVIYNSECYYFKNFDYFNSKGAAHLLYPLFQKTFCKKFKKAIRKAAISVYISKELKDEYDNAFHLPSAVIYTATDVLPLDAKNKKESDCFTVSYLGNMGVGRVDSLCEFAKILREVHDAAHLDVYGKVRSQEIIEKFNTHPNIRYKGFVSYEEVLNVMRNSDLLIHVESFDDFYKEDLKFAFSTKIADSLASGTCFLLYAPESLTCTKYLLGNQAAYVAVDRAQLKEHLKTLTQDENARTRYLRNAQQLVRTNHNAQKNAKAFQHILLEAYQSGK